MRGVASKRRRLPRPPARRRSAPDRSPATSRAAREEVVGDDDHLGAGADRLEKGGGALDRLACMDVAGAIASAVRQPGRHRLRCRRTRYRRRNRSIRAASSSAVRPVLQGAILRGSSRVRSRVPPHPALPDPRAASHPKQRLRAHSADGRTGCRRDRALPEWFPPRSRCLLCPTFALRATAGRHSALSASVCARSASVPAPCALRQHLILGRLTCASRRHCRVQLDVLAV